MAESPIAAVFFDLGDTLGSAVFEGQPPRLAGFDIFPFVRDTLASLKARVVKLGVISNTGNDTGPVVNGILAADLAPGGRLADLDRALLVYSGDEGVTKASPEIFHRAAKRAGLEATPARCLFVGESAPEREVAIAAGWRVCPHPALVTEVLDGQALQYVRLTVAPARLAQPWRDELRKRSFVPMHIAGPGGGIVYGLTSRRVVGELGAMGFDTDLLGAPDLPRTTDLYLLRDDIAARSGFLSPQGAAARTFAMAGDGPLILKYLADGGVIAALPGHLSPDDLHFDGAKHGHTVRLAPDSLLWAQPQLPTAPAAFVDTAGQMTPALRDRLTAITAAELLETVERYSGPRPLSGTDGGGVVSRHVSHADNARAVQQLAADLDAAGQGRLAVRRHAFSFGGGTLHNVEAELTGASNELVLVTAHLDSTAAADAPYNPAADSAPGADDDASGVAAVLAVARRFAAVATDITPARTVRFVLFNAEEQGLIGSQAYARRSKARGESIAAVWQMDMIGYNREPPLSWEIHAGFEPSPVVEGRSRRLAELLRDVAADVSPTLAPGQVYHSGTPGGDPAAGRSDHASFQAQGYPACVASEDFFAGPGADAPEEEENPNYHKPEDTFIDPEYAAHIARAVAVAAWLSLES